MKIWQITIGTEEGGDNIEAVSGVAETAQEAISKAMKFAKEEGNHKEPYPSRVIEMGEQIF